MNRKTIISLVAGVIAILLALAGVRAYNWYGDNRLPNFTREAVVYVYPQTTVAEVFANIADSAGVKRPRSLHRAFESKEVRNYLQPGRYVVKPEHSSVYVARMLNNAWQTPASLVLSGTMRKNSQIAQKVGRQLMIDSTAVAQALADEELLARYGFTPQNVFSLIIPDTYQIYWTVTVDELFDRLKKAYDDFWTEDNVRKAEAQGLTREEASILASIVKGETNYEPEMPTIAGVYLNRLHKGMRLQADPTIAFCYDYTLNRILRAHLDVESPYNTYKYAGLPPGPIAVPTRACLNAVLNPDIHDYIFFCANSNFNGSHKFAASYSEHLKNARDFQQALNRRNANR